MSESNNELLRGVQELQSDITEVKIVLARNTESLEHHIKRTDTLQDLVEPVYKDFIERKAVEEFRKKQREALIYKLKLPGYIAAALAAIGAILTWLGSR